MKALALSVLFTASLVAADETCYCRGGRNAGPDWFVSSASIECTGYGLSGVYRFGAHPWFRLITCTNRKTGEKMNCRMAQCRKDACVPNSPDPENGSHQ